MISSRTLSGRYNSMGHLCTKELKEAGMRFTKMQAFGNDYVYLDAIHQELKNLPELARF